MSKNRIQTKLGVKIAIYAAVFIAILSTIYYLNHVTRPDLQGDGIQYAVGSPGPGELAPQFKLPSNDETQFDLSSYSGKSVLLFFQEGAMCQNCWVQIQEIEQSWKEFEALGISQMVSITNDSLDILQQKAEIERINIPLLSDGDLTVSRAYTTNLYGMMGSNYNGHSFILVGPDGSIQWRADYGGKPNYTMFVPVQMLLDEIRQSIGETE